MDILKTLVEEKRYTPKVTGGRSLRDILAYKYEWDFEKYYHNHVETGDNGTALMWLYTLHGSENHKVYDQLNADIANRVLKVEGKTIDPRLFIHLQKVANKLCGEVFDENNRRISLWDVHLDYHFNRDGYRKKMGDSGSFNSEVAESLFRMEQYNYGPLQSSSCKHYLGKDLLLIIKDHLTIGMFHRFVK